MIVSSRFPDAVRPQLGSFVEQLVLAVAARGNIEIEVVAPVGVQPFPLSLRPPTRRLAAIPAEEIWKGVKVYRPRYLIPPRAGWLTPFFMARALRPLLPQIHERFPYELLSAQFFWPEGPALGRCNCDPRVPLSTKARGPDVEPEAWKRSRRLILSAARSADAFLAVSEPVRQRMIGLGIAPSRIAVHLTGLDHALFKLRDKAAAKRSLRIDCPLILWVGNLIGRKSPLLALETLARIPEAIMIMAGTGPEIGNVRRRVEELQLQERVRLVGRVSPEQMAQLYAAADVTLHTASWEGLSNVWVESLACGTPIVVAELEAAKPLVAAPGAGRVVDRDPARLAQTVREMFRLPPNPQLVADASASFSWDRSAAEFEDHLRALACERSLRC